MWWHLRAEGEQPSGLDPTGNSLEGSLQETMEEVNENALYRTEGCLKVSSLI